MFIKIFVSSDILFITNIYNQPRARVLVHVEL